MAKYSDNWGGLTPENKTYIDDMFERFVPWSGKANTIGGEIVRAINRICYRFYNDGDTVAHYYGNEYNLSWACDDFLAKHVKGYNEMKDIEDEWEFEDALAENFNYIAEYLKAHEELFTTENTIDCLDNAPLSTWDEDDF